MKVLADISGDSFAKAIMKSPAPRQEDKEGDELLHMAWGALVVVCVLGGCKVAGLLYDWSPAVQMLVILYSLHSMLVDVKADAFEPCWSENKLMQSMIQQLASDRADYDRVARKWTQAHAVGASHFLRRCSPAIRRHALYLMWVARQLEALHGLPADALLDPWVEFVVPLCVFVPDKTEKEADDLPN
jgi:hypothetical protein